MRLLHEWILAQAQNKRETPPPPHPGLGSTLASVHLGSLSVSDCDPLATPESYTLAFVPPPLKLRARQHSKNIACPSVQQQRPRRTNIYIYICVCIYLCIYLFRNIDIDIHLFV